MHEFCLWQPCAISELIRHVQKCDVLLFVERGKKPVDFLDGLDKVPRRARQHTQQEYVACGTLKT